MKISKKIGANVGNMLNPAWASMHICASCLEVSHLILNLVLQELHLDLHRISLHLAH